MHGPKTSWRLMLAMACLTTGAAVAPATLAAQEPWLVEYRGGLYDNDILDDDWYYDSYYHTEYEPNENPVEYDYEADWYDYEMYDGHYDDDPSDDWYYDEYGDVGEAGLYDT